MFVLVLPTTVIESSVECVRGGGGANFHPRESPRSVYFIRCTSPTRLRYWYRVLDYC